LQEVLLLEVMILVVFVEFKVLFVAFDEELEEVVELLSQKTIRKKRKKKKSCFSIENKGKIILLLLKNPDYDKFIRKNS
jgi:hypothetical protein